MENQNKSLLLIEDLGLQFPSVNSKKKYRYGIYECFCGKQFKTQTRNINSNNTKSCGCEKYHTTHSMSKHKLYNTWNMMIQRCTNFNNKSYGDYGAIGINICQRWLKIENFINDMFPTFQEGLTLDRINNEGNYEPSNCRWASSNVQARNKRRLMSTNTSGHKGVRYNKKNKKWIARIIINKKEIYLGSFDSNIEGAIAYDNYVIANNLEHTRNF